MLLFWVFWLGLTFDCCLLVESLLLYGMLIFVSSVNELALDDTR